jgi:hypothetical protein
VAELVAVLTQGHFDKVLELLGPSPAVAVLFENGGCLGHLFRKTYCKPR